jgi:hypothetical protein
MGNWVLEKPNTVVDAVELRRIKKRGISIS